MNKKISYAFLFFKFFTQEILIYEVKKSTLIGTKDFLLHRDMINILLNTFSKDLTKESFQELIINELNPKAIKIQKRYLFALKDRFEDKITQELNKEVVSHILKFDYVSAIRTLEKALNIIDNIQLNVNNVEPHISSSIYENDYKRMNDVLKDFNEAFNYFNQAIIDNILVIPKLEDTGSKKFITENEYLVYVIYNEAWNFLSHLGYAISYFNSPRKYISNIDKGIGHLRRAILDIYDGLIVETQEINEDYLRIRSVKLESLGCNDKIEDLSLMLKDHYLKYL